VLIVEDKPDNRLLLRSILNVLGVQVREANDGVEAVELFRAWQPDFIWMDRRMPRMNGEEATRRIRSLPGGDDVIIVALTASAFTDEREKVMASGMDDFVVKPYSPDEIYEKMQRYLSLRYIYKDSEKMQESETGKFSPKAYKEALKMVDEKRLDALYEAALLLDVQEVQNVVAAMDDTAPEAARMTRWLADRMEFHEILEAIGAVKEGRKT
jgi:CheY-like chemotaxis protein